MSIIDISLPLQVGIPVWPGSMELSLRKVRDLNKGDESNVSELHCDVHTGTHIDAPLHFLKGGKSIDQLPLDILCGEAQVIDLTNTNLITEKVLSSVNLPKGSKRLLLNTSNSDLWNQGLFSQNYVALSECAARWLVDNGFRLIGIDYLSIAPFNNTRPVHEILLGSDVIIVEGLNLSAVQPGSYQLFCLPLKLMGSDGAPARAILRSV